MTPHLWRTEDGVPGGQLAATTAPASLAQVAASLGFRRVELVQVLVGPRRTTAVVTGVVHRYPRTVPIPLATAARLIVAGAALRIDHGSDGKAR